MAEREPQHHQEQLHHRERSAERSAEHEQHIARGERGQEHAAEKKQRPVHELEQQAKHEARKASETLSKAPEAPHEQVGYVSRELKREALQRTLTRVRKQLSAPSRTFSKVIHQPAVNAVSQVTGQTVARPSGLLGGSICAFLGSSIFLWMAKHYGFNYNYLLFFLLFIVGFAVGMVLELSLFFVRRKRA